MFMPFTNDEIESIRSIVLIGQQNNDMLLSNCSSRPIVQTKSFIQRFKRLLLDTQNSIADITKSANEQYVAIIAGVRVKKNPKLNSMPSATSVANLASPLLKIPRSFPHKFFSKFAKYDDEDDIPISKTKNLPPPLPTRSRSISDGLSNYDQPFRYNKAESKSSKHSEYNSSNSLTTTRFSKKNSTPKPITMPNIDFRNSNFNANYTGYNKININSTASVNNGIYFNKKKALPQPQFISQAPTTYKQEPQTNSSQYISSFNNIPVVPPPSKKFPRSCNSVLELPPGTLAALFINRYDPAFICRVLASRNINGMDYVLISFFQNDFSQLYVLPQQLAVLPSFIPSQKLNIPEPLTVDSLLENIVQAAQCIVMDNEIQPENQNNSLLDQNHREILFKSLVCASYLIFLDFFSKYIVPKEKVELILNSIDLLDPPKYSTTAVINRRCRELVNKIISMIENPA